MSVEAGPLGALQRAPGAVVLQPQAKDGMSVTPLALTPAAHCRRRQWTVPAETVREKLCFGRRRRPIHRSLRTVLGLGYFRLEGDLHGEALIEALGAFT